MKNHILVLKLRLQNHFTFALAVLFVTELKLQNHFWKYWYWYWYCTKEKSKLLQYFAKPYVVNIAIILRLNHQYCKNIGIEKILKLQKYVSDIEIEIEIAKIFFRYWYWNWFRIFFLQVLILKLILHIFSSAIEMLTILKISVLRSPGTNCNAYIYNFDDGSLTMNVW